MDGMENKNDFIVSKDFNIYVSNFEDNVVASSDREKEVDKC